MTYRVTGFILKKKDLREYDRLYTLYTSEFGKCEVMAQGTRKLASKLNGKLELLNHVSCIFAKGKSLDRIASVDMIASYQGMKENLDRLSVALYCMDVTDAATKVGVQDAALYMMMEDFFGTLAMMNEGPFSRLGMMYVVKLACVLGYRPEKKNVGSFLDTLLESSFQKTISTPAPRNLEPVFRSSLTHLLERPVTSQIYLDYLMATPHVRAGR